MSKFKLLKDLGTIIVPKTYRHETALTTFAKQHGEKLVYCNPALTDANFGNPSRILKAGDILHATAWCHADGVSFTLSTDRMNFLRSKDAVFVSAQGGALTFVQKRRLLPKVYRYSSMDEPEKLWKDAGCYHRVPGVDADHDGDFRFNLSYFGDDWSDDDALLCFCDETSGT